MEDPEEILLEFWSHLARSHWIANREHFVFPHVSLHTPKLHPLRSIEMKMRAYKVPQKESSLRKESIGP